MSETKLTRDHHLWTRDTIKNVSGDVTLDIAGDITFDAYGKQIYFAFNGTSYVEFDFNAGTYKFMDAANVLDYFKILVDREGATTLSTVDADTAVAHLTLDPDGDINLNAIADVNIPVDIGLTFNASGAKIEGSTNDLTIASGRHLTLDAGGNIALEPATGSSILLDGTIDIDAGVITGATSITSTAFVGALTGNASGTAATVTGAAQTNITSLGTLTALTVDDVAINGKVITITGDTDDTFTITAGTHGATTIATVDDAAAAGDLTLDVDGDIILDAAGKQVYFGVNGTNYISLDMNAHEFKFMAQANQSDYFQISVGAEGVTTLSTVDADTAVAHLTLDPDGDLIISGADTKIDATKKLYLDGGGDTYIHEASADFIKIYVGGDAILQIAESGDNGNAVNFAGAVGFTRLAATFGSSGVIGDGNDSTDIDFRFGNKYLLELTDNISGSSEFINMIFPSVSGNFLLALTQDGTGSRTVASAGWVAYHYDETLCNNLTGADGTDGVVRWAGGSAPTLTTTADKTDIISIFWDATTQTVFAVASLNF